MRKRIGVFIKYKLGFSNKVRQITSFGNLVDVLFCVFL